MKRLYRSKKDKVLCGICGGLAEYFNVDPVLVRLAAVALFVLQPALAVILYLAACFLVPEASEGEEAVKATGGTGEAAKVVAALAGALLLAIGVLLIAHSVIAWSLVDLLKWLLKGLESVTSLAMLLAGIVLVVVGIVLIAVATKKG